MGPRYGMGAMGTLAPAILKIIVKEVTQFQGTRGSARSKKVSKILPLSGKRMYVTAKN